MRRFSCLIALALVGAVVVSCGSSGLFAEPKPALAPTTVAPTFVHLEVTPVPTETPQPTLVPTPVKVYTDAELADPVFPDELDPDLSEVKPEDEVIFERWRQFLSNTILFIDGEQSEISLCADRVLTPWLASEGYKAEWYVTRSVAIPESFWGEVEVRLRITNGSEKGVDWNLLQLSRKEGKIWKLYAIPAMEYEFKRSLECLEIADSFDYGELADLAAPVFPDGVDPEFFDKESGEERPTDEVVYKSWTDYLTNTSLKSEGAHTTWHLCEDGVVLNDAGFDRVRQQWVVKRSSGISPDDWGTVAVMVTAMSGRFEGREFVLLQLTRRHGRVFVTNTADVGEVEITRSKQCLAYSN